MRPHPRRPPRPRQHPRRPAATPAAPAAGGEAAAPAAGGAAWRSACLDPPRRRGTRQGQHSERRAEKPVQRPTHRSASIAAIAEEGHHRYLSAGCNGCHGGGGGGGMCPPLTNETWVYGADDDTLFRLITLGSDGLNKAGYSAPQARGRGRADAALRSDHQDQRRSLEDHRLHPLGEPELDQERGRRTLRTKALLSVSPDLIGIKAAKLGTAWRSTRPASGLAQCAARRTRRFCASPAAVNLLSSRHRAIAKVAIV